MRTFALPMLFTAFLSAGVATAEGPKTDAPKSDAPKPAKLILELAQAHIEVDEAIVVSEKLGDGRDPYVQRPASGKRDEIAMRGGAGLARDLTRTYDEAFTKECVRRVDGSFIFADQDYAELSRLTFSWGLITEVGFPALDVTSKDAATVSVKLQPEFPRRILQHGTPLTRPAPSPTWLRSSFKLSIDGVEPALKSVRQVSELRVSQTPNGTAPVQCAPETVSDLSFLIPQADAGGLAGWVGGAARTGSLDYLAADGSSVIKIKLNGLKKKTQAAEGNLVRVTASVDSIGFDANKTVKSK